MEQNIFNLNNKIYSNNNNILIEIINDLNKLMKYSKDNIIIKSLGNIINKMNYIITENKKYLELIRNDINKLYNKFDELKINNTINNQELKFDVGRYKGQVVNGMPEGKGIVYHINGNRLFEGDWKNGKFEGKGIFYWNNGDRYEGDFRNDNKEGKGIMYFNDGDRYEGDFRYDKM